MLRRGVIRNTRSMAVRKYRSGKRQGGKELSGIDAKMYVEANASPTSKEGDEFEEIYRAGAT